MGKEADQRTHTVFVYGTLKRGFSNHYFLRDARFVGKARTVHRYALYVDEYPGVHAGDKVCPIMGEVFEVDAGNMNRLDALEDHPRLYKREQIDVVLESGEKRRAWIYFTPRKTGRLIASGEFNPKKELGIS